MTIAKDGRAIHSLEDWEKHAGPKHGSQWRDGYSAKEAARYWLATKDSSLPREVATLLASHDRFGPVLRWAAEPEVRLPFDQFRGEPRNADLLVTANDAHGEYLIAIEAKVNEAFGETAGDALANALERKLKNPRSNGVTRIERLSAALLGPRREGEAALASIRYQLLTATAGALYAAAQRGASRVLMLVQEFQTSASRQVSQVENARDLDVFVGRLSHGAVTNVQPDRILGPIMIADSSILFEGQCPELFIAKIRCKV
jgi:hypothetical protein